VTRPHHQGEAAQAMGPVLHATLLVGARDGRTVRLDPRDCQELVAQLAWASALVTALRDVESLVQSNADTLGERAAIPGGALQGLALQVHALTRVALGAEPAKKQPGKSSNAVQSKCWGTPQAAERERGMRAGVNKRAGGTSEATRGGGRGEQGGSREDDVGKTGRVGPHHLGKCIARGTELGDIYLAHNVHTGCPAVVFRPTEAQMDGQSPCTWSARIGSLNGRSSLEVLSAQAPASVSSAEVCEEMAVTLGDLSKAMEKLLRSPEVLDHLMTPPPSRWWRWWRRTVRRFARVRQLVAGQWKNATIGLLTVGLLVAVGRRPELMPPPSPGPLEAPVAERTALASGLVEAAVEEPQMGIYDVGGILPAPTMLARDLPERPFRNHKRPPCRGSQKEINGGCWVATEEKPDCPDDQYEHKGKCWVPVLVPPGGDGGAKSIAQ
jgi:hypothetical protein